MKRLTHPLTGAERAERDRLLAACLREGAAGFPIAREYPIVLGEAGAGYSYCLKEGGRIVAHANLWPRVLRGGDGKTLSVGLVGNVATDEKLRGKGMMSALMRELEEAGVGMGLKALLLWSDLEGFYQKQGFSSCGREWRYGLARADLPQGSDYGVVKDPTPAVLRRLLAWRPLVGATLERSVDEFAAQLTIPATTLVVGPHGFCVVGKGCDLQGVAHEWGGDTMGGVLAACNAACEALGLDSVLLLSPQKMDIGVPAEEHPMGWVKMLVALDAGERALLDGAFVWGLDSI